MKLSLALFCLISFLVLESINSAAIFYLYQASPPQARQADPAAQTDAKLALTTAIIGLTGNMRSTAAHIAQLPQTINALKAGPDSAPQTLLIHALYPDAKVQRTLPNIGAVDHSPIPPLSVVYSRIPEMRKRNKPPSGPRLQAHRFYRPSQNRSLTHKARQYSALS